MYEVKYSYTTIDNKGNDKVVKNTIICEHAASFGDAEEIAYNFANGETDLDVIAVKRSSIKEIINRRASDNDKIFTDAYGNEIGDSIDLSPCDYLLDSTLSFDWYFDEVLGSFEVEVYDDGVII